MSNWKAIVDIVLALAGYVIVTGGLFLTSHLPPPLCVLLGIASSVAILFALEGARRGKW